jgi:hypothetical protein
MGQSEYIYNTTLAYVVASANYFRTVSRNIFPLVVLLKQSLVEKGFPVEIDVLRVSNCIRRRATLSMHVLSKSCNPSQILGITSEKR